MAGKEQVEKQVLLERADSKLETLKILLRLAKDTQSIDSKKYLNLESYLQEIGKMLGGWLKHAKQITWFRHNRRDHPTAAPQFSFGLSRLL